jgi:hypothetical protein
MERSQMKITLEYQKQQLHLAQEASNLFIDPEASGALQKINFSTGDALTEQDLQTVQQNGYFMWRTNALAHGWIELAVSFIVGSELHLKSLDEDPATQNCWDNFWRAEGMSTKAMEIVRRTLRDGECFIRLFQLPLDKANPASAPLTLRFLDPLRVKPNSADPVKTRFGIETKPDDIETVLAYWYDTTGQNDLVRISAEEIIHVKRSDSDFLRGVPWLFPINREIGELEKLYFARQLLHRIRASVIIDQEVRNTSPDMVNALLEKSKSSKDTSAAGTTKSIKNTPIGGIFVHSDNIKRTYQTPNIQAIDADADFRRQLLKCATMMGWAEYAATADASNSNYASTMIAESPFVKTLAREQVWFGEKAFNKLHRACTQYNIDAGLLTDTSKKTIKVLSGNTVTQKVETVPRPLDANCDYPNLIHRDFLQETQALILQRGQGALSLRTMQVKLELDPEEEELNLRTEEAEGIIRPSPMTANPGDAPAGRRAGSPNPNQPTAPEQPGGLPSPNEPANRAKSRTRPTNR